MYKLLWLIWPISTQFVFQLHFVFVIYFYFDLISKIETDTWSWVVPAWQRSLPWSLSIASTGPGNLDIINVTAYYVQCLSSLFGHQLSKSQHFVSFNLFFSLAPAMLPDTWWLFHRCVFQWIKKLEHMILVSENFFQVEKLPQNVVYSNTQHVICSPDFVQLLEGISWKSLCPARFWWRTVGGVLLTGDPI